MPSIALPVSLRGQLLSGSRFNPISLFSAGEQGVWYEPSDVANLAWRRNLLTRTEEFGDAAWSNASGTLNVTANTIAAPDGTLTADKLVPASATAYFAKRQVPIVSAIGITYTLAVYAKEGDTGVRLELVTYNSGITAQAIFNLATGAVVATGAGTTTSVGTADANGWRRYAITWTAILAATLLADVKLTESSTFGANMTGDGSKGILIWGAQLELGSTATDYQRISDVNTEVLERFPRTTMFQDRAGTTPVTTPGQTVGKRLDKSGRGNHAVAPTDAARPTYGIEPKTGRRNLLTYSEQFDNAAWGNAAGVVNVTANTETAPDGALTADKLIPAAATDWMVKRQLANLLAAAHTLSIWAKLSNIGVHLELFYSGLGAVFNLSTGAVLSSANCTTSVTADNGNGWRRYSITFTGSGTAAPTDIRVTESSTRDTQMTGNASKGILVWGAQLELGSTATAYQRVGTAFDVTEAGVPTVHYVQYDGTDDSFSTSSIDFTATNKMSVFAGARKSSDAASGILVELSANAGGNNGSFYVVTGPDPFAANRYSSSTRGSLSITASNTATTNIGNAPDQAVLSSTHDISGDLTTIRRNGVLGTSATVDLGLGNFGNHPLFIGRRNNATVPFNGRDYGIIVVGKTASATEITNTESYLAANTSGVSI